MQDDTKVSQKARVLSLSCSAKLFMKKNKALLDSCRTVLYLLYYWKAWVQIASHNQVLSPKFQLSIKNVGLGMFKLCSGPPPTHSYPLYPYGTKTFKVDSRALRWWGAKKLWSFPHILRSAKGQRSQIYFFFFFSLMICWKFLNLLLEGKMFIFNLSLYHNFENVVRHSILLGCYRQN